jgi:pilus assembly protein CpaB
VKSRLLTITLAVVLAVVGIVAVLAYVRQANVRAVNGLKAETVMVAAGAIPADTSLGEAQHDHLLGTEKVPESSLTSTAVQSVNKANKDMVVGGTVAKGQVLLLNMLTSSSSGTANAGSGFVIPPGMIAVSVAMCVEEAVADYVTPGSDVAVFDTFTGSDAQVTRSCGTDHQVLTAGAQAATALVLPKAEVLAVGQNAGSQSASGSSSVTVTTDPAASSSATATEVLVTLAVAPEDAERLILLDEVGLPYMALLGPESNVGSPPAIGLNPSQLPSGQ